MPEIRFTRRGPARPTPPGLGLRRQIERPVAEPDVGAEIAKGIGRGLQQLAGAKQQIDAAQQAREDKLAREQEKIDAVARRTDVQARRGELDAAFNQRMADLQSMTLDERRDNQAHVQGLEQDFSDALDGAPEDVAAALNEDLARVLPVMRQRLIQRAQDLTKVSIVAASGERAALAIDRTVIGFDAGAGERVGNLDETFAIIDNEMALLEEFGPGTPEQNSKLASDKARVLKFRAGVKAYQDLRNRDPVEAANLIKSGLFDEALPPGLLKTAKLEERSLRAKGINLAVSNAASAMVIAPEDYQNPESAFDIRHSILNDATQSIIQSDLPENDPAFVKGLNDIDVMRSSLEMKQSQFAAGVLIFESAAADPQTDFNAEAVELVAKNVLVPQLGFIVRDTPEETGIARADQIKSWSSRVGWVSPAFKRELASNLVLYAGTLSSLRRAADFPGLDVEALSPKVRAGLLSSVDQRAEAIVHLGVEIFEKQGSIELERAVVAATLEIDGKDPVGGFAAIQRESFFSTDEASRARINPLVVQALADQGGQAFDEEDVEDIIVGLPSAILTPILANAESITKVNGGNAKSAVNASVAILVKNGWAYVSVGNADPAWTFRPPQVVLPDPTGTVFREGRRVVWTDDQLNEALFLRNMPSTEDVDYGLHNIIDQATGEDVFQVLLADTRMPAIDGNGQPLFLPLDYGEFLAAKAGFAVDSPGFELFRQIRDPRRLQKMRLDDIFGVAGLAPSQTQARFRKFTDALDANDTRSLIQELMRRIEVDEVSREPFVTGVSARAIIKRRGRVGSPIDRFLRAISAFVEIEDRLESEAFIEADPDSPLGPTNLPE